MAGRYLAPNVYVDSTGEVWVYGRNGNPGLGGFFDAGGGWDKISNIISPIAGGFGQWLANKGQPKQPPVDYSAYPPGGVYAGANSGGLFGGIDTTTLLLIGGAVLLFMSRPSK